MAIPTNNIQSIDNFKKGELVRYSVNEYPWRIQALERGHVAWIAETRGTRYTSSGRVSRVLRVPIDNLRKTPQALGRFSED